MTTFSDEAGLTVLPNADDLLVAAAKGDRQAQAALVGHTIACADQGASSAGVCLGAAEVFARMAASHGRIEDRRRLSSVLLICASREARAGNFAADQTYQIEALALIDQLANEGDELSANHLVQYGAAFAPDILQLVAAAARRGNATY